MNAAAEAVMRELPDLVLAFGNSDEYRYALLQFLDWRIPCLREITVPLCILKTARVVCTWIAAHVSEVR